MNNITKWITKVTYIDIETGKIISNKQIENKQYTVINTEKNYIINGKECTRNIVNYCEPNRQQSIW